MGSGTSLTFLENLPGDCQKCHPAQSEGPRELSRAPLMANWRAGEFSSAGQRWKNASRHTRREAGSLASVFNAKLKKVSHGTWPRSWRLFFCRMLAPNEDAMTIKISAWLELKCYDEAGHRYAHR
jgi:hypothetical protein